MILFFWHEVYLNFTKISIFCENNVGKIKNFLWLLPFQKFYRQNIKFA